MDDIIADSKNIFSKDNRLLMIGGNSKNNQVTMNTSDQDLIKMFSSRIAEFNNPNEKGKSLRNRCVKVYKNFLNDVRIYFN
jgi:hypothetical protein